jgi:hypothetical protein
MDNAQPQDQTIWTGPNDEPMSLAEMQGVQRFSENTPSEFAAASTKSEAFALARLKGAITPGQYAYAVQLGYSLPRDSPLLEKVPNPYVVASDRARASLPQNEYLKSVEAQMNKLSGK